MSKITASVRLRVFAAVGASVTSCAFLTPAAADDTSPRQASTQRHASRSTPVADVAEQYKLRKEFGLDATPKHVAAVDANAESDESALGIPLTDAEADNVNKRDALTGDIDALAPLVGKLTGFGGFWIDQPGGGVLHVAVVKGSPAAAQVAAAVSKVASDSAPVVDFVKFSQSQLDSVKKTMSGLMATEVSIYAVMIQQPSNNVLVRVHADAGASIRAKAASLLGDLSDAADIQEDQTPTGKSSAATASAEPGLAFDQVNTPPDRSPSAARSPRDRISGPILGGEWIHGLGLGACSAGYSYSFSLFGTGHVYTVTAGHCGYDGVDFYQGRTSGGPRIGTADNIHFAPVGKGRRSFCDCLTVGPLARNTQTRQVIISKTQNYQYTRTATTGNYTFGQRACLTGAKYGDSNDGGIDCGTMQGSIDVRYGPATGADDYTLLDAGLTTIQGSNNGDSGGAYGNGGAFLGVHAGYLQAQGGLDSGAIFSKSQHFDVMNVAPEYDVIN